MCGAIMLMFLISRTTIGTLKGDLEIAQIRLDGCRREVDIEHARGDTFRDMLGSTEYVLWEVHALGPGAEWPGTKQMEVLCERLGDHSVLKTGTELVGYSYWGDVLGNPKIGCRYAKRLAP
jgi:hypothetical protein